MASTPATNLASGAPASVVPASVAPAIPQIIVIPKAILDAPGKDPESRQQLCLLLSTLPSELLRKIVRSKKLSIFDRACLMLTCKSFARHVTTFGGKLSIPGQLKSGNEDFLIQIEFDEWTDMDEDDFELAYEARVEEYGSRIDPVIIRDFFVRLDLGWNTSQTRYCKGCGIFKSTDQKFWDRKLAKYLYTTSSKTAEAWRQVEDCMCHGSAQGIIKPWVDYGVQRAEEIQARNEENSVAEMKSMEASQVKEERISKAQAASEVKAVTEKTEAKMVLKCVSCPDCRVAQRCNCDCRFEIGCGCPCGVCCGPCYHQ